jgi:hypothetical protein
MKFANTAQLVDIFLGNVAFHTRKNKIQFSDYIWATSSILWILGNITFQGGKSHKEAWGYQMKQVKRNDQQLLGSDSMVSSAPKILTTSIFFQIDYDEFHYIITINYHQMYAFKAS